MFRSVVFTFKSGKVDKTTDHLLADMAGLEEDELIKKMVELGFTPGFRAYSEEADSEIPVFVTFTKKLALLGDEPADIPGM